jgi:hypothetical protein
MSALADALEPLVPTVVSLLTEALQRNEQQGCGILVHLLRVLPLLNREARDLWRKEEEAKHLLTLCNYLFGYGERQRRRYLDGVLPSGFPESWEEPLAAAEDLAPTEPERIIALHCVFKNRADFAKKIVEEMAKNGSLLDDRKPATGFLLSILQSHCAWKLHRDYPGHFGTCQRVGCSRPAYLHPPSEREQEPDSAPSEAEYWKCCRDGRAPPPTSSLPSDMCFCCHGCYKVTNTEFKRLVRFNITTPMCETRRGAPPTPARLFRAAVKRNIGVARSLRAQEQVQTTHYPSTMANRDTMLREQTTMLSVDLGLLYAASLVHELPYRSRPNRSLPSTENWRMHGTRYFNAICRVREVYMKYGRGELARDGSEFWLKRLRDNLLSIF